MPKIIEYPDELTHYGRLGMKWGQHIFGRERSYTTSDGKQLTRYGKKKLYKRLRNGRYELNAKGLEYNAKIRSVADKEINASDKAYKAVHDSPLIKKYIKEFKKLNPYIDNPVASTAQMEIFFKLISEAATIGESAVKDFDKAGKTIYLLDNNRNARPVTYGDLFVGEFTNAVTRVMIDEKAFAKQT